MNTEESFWTRVDRHGPIPTSAPDLGPCWIWTGSTDRYGYGRVSYAGKDSRAHRVAWKLTNGEPPEFLDHRCHTKACVHPGHMRPATTKQNGENRSGARSDNHSSGERGVTFHKGAGKWQSQVWHSQQCFYLGLFDTREEASSAASAKRRELFTHSDMDEGKLI